MVEAKLGVDGRPNVGEEARLAAVLGPVIRDPGRARREGERPVGGSGDEDRTGGAELPVYFF